jgi:uncharacterized protein YwgA
MTDNTKNVALVLQAADGEIIGRIRFQKIFYLLEQLGMQSDISFSYHHYGPYSEELSIAIERASLPGGPIKEEKKSISDNYYSVYSSVRSKNSRSDNVGGLPWKKVCEYVQIMKAESSMVLEIAATVHWLQTKENVKDWKTELKNRKGSKAEDSRIEKALSLLGRLGIKESINVGA